MKKGAIICASTWIANGVEVSILIAFVFSIIWSRTGLIIDMTSIGDPISVTVHRHPHKKHFGKPLDDTNYDPAKPHMPLPKVKLLLSKYQELDPNVARDTEFIVNVPFQKYTGDPIEVMIGDKVISVQIPQLERKHNRFIVCFIG